MLTVARIRREQWHWLKEMRLTALQEAPYAFGSTYAETAPRPDADWQELTVRRATSPNDCLFFVLDDGIPVGMAGGYRENESPQTVHMVSVWVAPSHRGSTAASLVVEAIYDWAVSVSATEIISAVTGGNERALRFYLREGFHDTGERLPYPPDSSKQEIVITRLLSR